MEEQSAVSAVDSAEPAESEEVRVTPMRWLLLVGNRYVIADGIVVGVFAPFALVDLAGGWRATTGASRCSSSSAGSSWATSR